MVITTEEINLLIKATRFSVTYFIELAQRESEGETIEEDYDPNDVMVIDIITSQLEEALEIGHFETADVVKGESFLTYPVSIYISEKVGELPEKEYTALTHLFRKLKLSYIENYRNMIPPEHLHENISRIEGMKSNLENILNYWETQRIN
jgi:hypothetical protein